MTRKKLQCKHMPDAPILLLLEKSTWPSGMTWYWCEGIENSVVPAFPPNAPDKLIIAKMNQLIRRGLVSGCSCGCRGDYEITDKGLAWVKENKCEQGNLGSSQSLHLGAASGLEMGTSEG